MPGLKLTVSTNTDEIAGKFRNLARKVANKLPPNKALAVQLFGDMQRNFETLGSTFGYPWEPLAESTLREKARLGYSPLPLRRTGFLKNTAYSNATGEFAEVGYLASYASYHDDTDDKYVPGKRLPRRRLLPPLDFAYRQGVAVYEWYIRQSIDEERL